MSDSTENLNEKTSKRIESVKSSEQPTNNADYDQDFLLAYALLEEHVRSGSSTTSDLARALEDITKVVRSLGRLGGRKR